MTAGVAYAIPGFSGWDNLNPIATVIYEKLNSRSGIALIAANRAIWVLRSNYIFLRLKKMATDGHIRAAQREQSWHGHPYPKVTFAQEKENDLGKSKGFRVRRESKS